uniref:Uncharacterized protein n=1 Tax=Globodera rostochiensis TaxID=31243 RepID=A0A914H4T8_GLORO
MSFDIIDDEKLAKNYVQILIDTVHLAAEPLNAIRYELLEQHTINLIRLNQSKNAFSEFLKNSLTEEKGAMHKLNKFYIDQNVQMALKCFEKYPDIQRMCRAELSFDQITQLEIKNYIRYFDYKTDELMWMKAELLLSMLAYYKLFLKHSKIDIQATTEYMATAENTMDSVADQNNVEDIRFLSEKEIFILHMAKNKLFQEEIIVYEESKEPIKRFLLETHNHVLNVLLENDEFIDKLKDIYIDRERLSNIIPQNSKTFKLLIAGSLDDVPTEKDIEAFNLTKIYEDIMIDKKSEFDKDRLTIEASYFYYKILLKDLLSMLTPLKSMKNPKFMRMVIEVEVENAKLEDFLSKLNKNDGKPIKICYLKSFTSSIIENRAMILENATWKDLLIERNYLNNKEIMRDSPNSHIKWMKPETAKSSNF